MNRVLGGKEERFLKGDQETIRKDVDFDEPGRIYRFGYVDVVKRIKEGDKPMIVLYYWKNSLVVQSFLLKVKSWWSSNKKMNGKM